MGSLEPVDPVQVKEPRELPQEVKRRGQYGQRGFSNLNPTFIVFMSRKG